MSDGVANPSKEIKRPGLRDGQTEGYLSNKQDEQNLAKKRFAFVLKNFDLFRAIIQ